MSVRCDQCKGETTYHSKQYTYQILYMLKLLEKERVTTEVKKKFSNFLPQLCDYIWTTMHRFISPKKIHALFQIVHSILFSLIF